MSTTLYAALVAAGCQIDHHESDLYVRDTLQAQAIIHSHATPVRARITRFRSALDGEWWLDIPFAYQPYWDARAA